MAKEILAEARGGVVHSRGSPLHVRGAEQPDCSVAQFLTLHEDENDEEKDDTSGGQRRKYRPCDAPKNFKRLGRLLMNLDRDRLAPFFDLLGWTWLGADFWLWLRIGELALQVFYRLGGLLQGGRTGRRFAKRTYFFG